MGCHWRILVYIFICLFPPPPPSFSLSRPPFSLSFYFISSFFSSLSTYMVWLWQCALSFIYKSPSVTLCVGYIIPGCFFFLRYRRSINSVARGKDEGGWWFGCKWQHHHHYGVIPHEMAGIITASALWPVLSGWANAERLFYMRVCIYELYPALSGYYGVCFGGLSRVVIRTHHEYDMVW